MAEFVVRGEALDELSSKSRKQEKVPQRWPTESKWYGKRCARNRSEGFVDVFLVVVENPTAEQDGEGGGDVVPGAPVVAGSFIYQIRGRFLADAPSIELAGGNE
jgi:hypothetical protein